MPSRQNSRQIFPRFAHTFNDRSGEKHRPSHHQNQAVLGLVRAARRGTCVMAEEVRPHFCLDRMRQQSYREDLVDAIGYPSAVWPDAER
jgi:hypothetical protein